MLYEGIGLGHPDLPTTKVTGFKPSGISGRWDVDGDDHGKNVISYLFLPFWHFSELTLSFCSRKVHTVLEPLVRSVETIKESSESFQMLVPLMASHSTSEKDWVTLEVAPLVPCYLRFKAVLRKVPILLV